MKYRIGIDAHAIGKQLTGNETYITNLIDGLMALDSGHRFVLLFTDEDSASAVGARYPEAEIVLSRVAQPLVRIPFVLPYLVARNKLDMLHVQYVGPPIFNKPLVASIHDISFETHPEFFSPRERNQFRLTFPFTARQANKILTISEHTRNDLMEIYGIPGEKVIVTYLAASDNFQPLSNSEEGSSVHQKYGIGESYILAVGNLQPRKNMIRLIQAYTRLRDAMPEIRSQLVIVGKKAWMHDPILSFVTRSKWADDIILTGYVPDEDLRFLYARAGVFVYPSLYEGFGLPPLEAMACGTPVIVSDRASLPEVVGDAGIKVNPYDVEGLAAAVAVLLLDPEVVDFYKQAGLRQAARFSWEKCAKETLAVYEEALREDRGF